MQKALMGVWSLCGFQAVEGAPQHAREERLYCDSGGRPPGGLVGGAGRPCTGTGRRDVPKEGTIHGSLLRGQTSRHVEGRHDGQDDWRIGDASGCWQKGLQTTKGFQKRDLDDREPQLRGRAFGRACKIHTDTSCSVYMSTTYLYTNQNRRRRRMEKAPGVSKTNSGFQGMQRALIGWKTASGVNRTSVFGEGAKNLPGTRHSDHWQALLLCIRRAPCRGQKAKRLHVRRTSYTMYCVQVSVRRELRRTRY